MIRKARIEDLEELIPLFEIAHRNTIFKDTEIDEMWIKRMMAMGVAMPDFFCEVVEHKGRIVGILGAQVAKNIWGSRMASDVIFYSKRETNVLLTHFHKWAKSKVAGWTHITNLAENPRFNNLLENVGYKPAGQCLAREV